MLPEWQNVVVRDAQADARIVEGFIRDDKAITDRNPHFFTSGQFVYFPFWLSQRCLLAFFADNFQLAYVDMRNSTCRHDIFGWEISIIGDSK